MLRLKCKIYFGLVFLILNILIAPNIRAATYAQPIIADHSIANMVRLDQIPDEAIIKAKNTLHIAYQHTSHGSQIITGMNGLPSFKEANNGTIGLYSYNSTFLRDNAISSYAPDPSQAVDVGYSQWMNATRNFLNDPDNSEINVIMWSWCGQASHLTEQEMIDHYLNPMSELEKEFPNVMFVYMTGHVDGTGLEGNLHQRNEQIRNFVKDNNKILFDFADIESYDPDGNYFGDKYVKDDCSWHNDTDSGNWALDWQNSHEEGVDWYNCNPAHTQALNGNLKAYAAWWLFATLAGWNQEAVNTNGTTNNPSASDKVTISMATIFVGLLSLAAITSIVRNRRR